MYSSMWVMMAGEGDAIQQMGGAWRRRQCTDLHSNAAFLHMQEVWLTRSASYTPLMLRSSRGRSF